MGNPQQVSILEGADPIQTLDRVRLAGGVQGDLRKQVLFLTFVIFL
jgi:hypothetical protein